LAAAGFAAAGFGAADFAASGLATVPAETVVVVSPAGAIVAAGAAVSVSAAPADASDLPLHPESDRAVSANAHVTATMCAAREADDRVLMFSFAADGTPAEGPPSSAYEGARAKDIGCWCYTGRQRHLVVQRANRARAIGAPEPAGELLELHEERVVVG
jgi:hypothetical protein